MREFFAEYFVFIVVDISIFISGVVGGIVFNIFVSAKILREIYISPNFKGKEWNIARIPKGGKTYVYLNPKTYRQTLATWVSFLWWRFTGRKHDYLLENKRKQGQIAIILFTLSAVIIVYGLYAVFTIQHVHENPIKYMNEHHEHK